MWFLVASSLVLCACVNGLAVGEKKAAPSPLVYETFADAGQYLFDPTPHNWTDASKVCRGYNGHLAYPKTQDEADALWSIMTRYNVKQVHAGFHDQFIEGEYYTAKGRLLNETSFNKWSSGAPVGGSSRNCGGLRDDGLVDVACSDSYPSICEENPPIDNGVPQDYDYIEGHGYYKYYFYADSWQQAVKTCYNDGAYLIIPNSQEEIDAVYEKYGQMEMYVGIHRYHAGDYFVTIFDDTLESTGYQKWAPNHPWSDYNYYPIVKVYLTGLYTYEDHNTLGEFICEYDEKQ